MSDNEIALSGEHFDVVRSLTLELPNLPQEPLLKLGWDASLEESLKQLVRSVPTDIAPAQQVRILLCEGGTGDPVLRDEPADSSEIVRSIPGSIARVWPRLLEAAFHAPGAREARYRTGFYEEEIVDALGVMNRLE